MNWISVFKNDIGDKFYESLNAFRERKEHDEKANYAIVGPDNVQYFVAAVDAILAWGAKGQTVAWLLKRDVDALAKAIRTGKEESLYSLLPWGGKDSNDSNGSNDSNARTKSSLRKSLNKFKGSDFFAYRDSKGGNVMHDIAMCVAPVSVRERMLDSLIYAIGPSWKELMSMKDNNGKTPEEMQTEMKTEKFDWYKPRAMDAEGDKFVLWSNKRHATSVRDV
jgi:hypothetical protein